MFGDGPTASRIAGTSALILRPVPLMPPITSPGFLSKTEV
jgi:hypothetical protein